MVCVNCQSHRLRRITREGFLRTTLAPLFGYFPWRCSVCRTEQLLKVRGKRTNASDQGSSYPDSPSQSASPLRQKIVR
jgi:hypothetical protein